MLTVHHLGLSQSERVVWICEELGISYELNRYDRGADGMAPKDYKALHPLGTSPIITDGEIVLPESGAIVEYINNKYGAGRLGVAPYAANYASYLFWFHFANGTMMPNEMIGLDGPPGTPEALGGFMAPIMRERRKRSWALVEQRLGEAAYFAGPDFTAADVMMVFALTTMRAFAPWDASGYPNVLAYLQRIGGRPAYRRAMQKGDPELSPVLS